MVELLNQGKKQDGNVLGESKNGFKGKTPLEADTLKKQRKLAFRKVNNRLRSVYGKSATQIKCLNKIKTGNRIYSLGIITSLFDPNWKDFSALKEKDVLDIGCGTKAEHNQYRGNGWEDKFGSEFNNDRLFEPWLCRALLEIGANPVGVDINPNYGEQFKSIRLNIVTTDLASIFFKDSFDIIHTSFFFPPNTSPILSQIAAKHLKALRKSNMTEFINLVSKCYNMSSYKGRALIDPEREIDLWDYDGFIAAFVKYIANSVKSSVESLLKEGGIYLSECCYSIKKDGKLTNELDIFAREGI